MASTGARPLLAAKLLVPPPGRTLVVRPRLDDLLRSAAGSRLTTVIAPAGWGKTTLLAGWAGDPAQASTVGWLSIDEADDEPVRFWTYALTALGTVAPALTRDALAALGASGLDPVGVALGALLNAATASPDRSVLVLDDYHLLADRAIHEGVEFLLAYLPPGLHLVIAARHDPPLPLARMRVRGTLTEIRINDLRYTAAESAALLGAAIGRPVDSRLAADVAQRTEGWPAGIQLAALTLRDAPDPTRTAARLRGDQRYILDYFSTEVLSGLDGAERDLLVRGSVLERLSGPLCDAMLQRSESSLLLERLDRCDLFVSHLGGQWYRCHRLFRDVLRRELDVTGAGEASALLVRAADWFLAEGRVEEAVEHRVAAGDRRGALELLRTSSRWFLDHGAMASLLRLGEGLAATEADPRLHLMLAYAAGLSGQTARTIAWLQAAEPLIVDGAASMPGWRSLRGLADTTWSTYGLVEDVEAALRFARRAVEWESDPTLWGHVAALDALAAAQFGVGEIQQAVDLLERARRAPAARELPTVIRLQSAGLLAFGLIQLRRPGDAARVCAEAEPLAVEAERAWGDGAAAAVAVLRAAGGLLVGATDPTAALPALHRAADLAEVWGRATVVVGALASLAETQWAAGDRTGARTSLDRAREVVDGETIRPDVLRRLDELESRIGRRAAVRARQRGQLNEELTDRELAILRALRGPLTAREIGAELFLSVNTVKGYTKSLYRKLGVVTRGDAFRSGHELGLI